MVEAFCGLLGWFRFDLKNKVVTPISSMNAQPGTGCMQGVQYLAAAIRSHRGDKRSQQV